MGSSHSTLSRSAAAVVAVLALLLLVSAATETDAPAYARVVMLGTALVSSVAAMVLWRDNTYDASAVTLVLALLSACGAVVVGLLGLPGDVRSGFGATSSGVLGLAVVLTVLLVLDARRCVAPDQERPPYAL